MQSQIVTALIAVVPSLLVLVIQQFFNVLSDKRAFKEHVLDNLIPERRKFYGDLMTFVPGGFAKAMNFLCLIG